MVVQACHPSTGEAEQEDYKFEACLGYIMRVCFKKQRKKLKMVNFMLCVFLS
jgi:hypothetical protein